MIGSARLIRSGNSTLPTLTIEYQENGVVLAGTEQTWFITGSSRGLGRALFRAARDAGDLVAEYGERI